MISSISWVPKGVSKSVSDVAEPSNKEETKQKCTDSESKRDEEYMNVDAAKKGDEVAHALAAEDALGKASKNTTSNFEDMNDDFRKLCMDSYEKEDDGINLGRLVGIGNAYYPSNDMDPYLKDNDDDEDSEEFEGMTIKPEDALIVCARCEDYISHLEVWKYDDTVDGDPNKFDLCHIIILASDPLCTAWLDFPLKSPSESGNKGNLIAVGSMEPAIEVWDLDVVQRLVKYNRDSHTDSVLCLAWNKEYRNGLASASADKLVKVWDIATGQCNFTMEHHTDKVQAVAWNHYAPVLLSGSFDHSVVMKDARVPSHPGFKWLVAAEVESLAWSPHVEYSFVASLANGIVCGFDIRAASDAPSNLRPSFTLHAHDKAVCTISYNPLAPNLLATGSNDNMVKLWDLSDNQPSCVASKNPNAGAIFSISFSENCPFSLAIGGSTGKLQVWETLSDIGVFRKFGSYWNQRRA